ncbi:polysaccharide biosynthesis tyrosine autokinase [Tychonema sp. BBK16]|uniref:GumC family protein n=1 Tax=Tychonema sp. BBK16 TaxID=2699888 RepID=UPI001F1855D6|nr:polysaccharide biosynthesis tyrosine autokinase [Tychonema sp. BBK16]MCF6372676.1 polysaccharide biosynthesis tyrosine autokinase [Tychonema sp. BBK16]
MESTETGIGVQEYWQILKRRWLPAVAVFASVLVLTTYSTLKEKPVYEAEGKLLFKKSTPGSALTELGKEIGQLTPAAEQSNPLTTEIELIRSVENIEKTINRLHLKDEKSNQIKTKDFLKKLTVATIRGADILTVSYKDKNPKIAADVVKTMMDFYIDNNQKVNRLEAVSVRQFIERKLPHSDKNMRKAAVELSKFKEDNKIVNLEEEAKSAVTVMAGLESQIDQAQSEFLKATAKSKAFENELRMNPQQALAASTLSQSSAVQEALKEYKQTERLLAIEQNRYVETSEFIVRLKSNKATMKGLLDKQIQQVLGGEKPLPNQALQIGEVKPKLIEEFIKVDVERQGLAQRVTILSNALAGYKERVKVLPKLEKEKRQLERKLQESEADYEELQKKLQQIRITENQQVGNARIVQRPSVPEEPVASRKSLLLVSGILLGTLLGIVAAIVLESQDKSVKTIEEARELFGFTLLGVIPFHRKPEKNPRRNSWRLKSAEQDLELSPRQIVVRDTPHTSSSAAYRMLQANLRFLSSDKELKVIVVSSSLPQEGKSTVSANLAVAIAQLGRKVLLVDADMHCPVQHGIWELPNQVGLSNVIVGQAELKSAIAQVMDNLDVLTCGVIPPNPMALLDSQRITSLIKQFSASYDAVIIDAPSLNVAADALILGNKADGILLVVRPGVLNSGTVAFAKELLKKSSQHVLGLVVNGVSAKNEPHSHYYFTNESYAQEQSASVNQKI